MVPLTDFHKSSRASDGLVSRCKECVRKTMFGTEKLAHLEPNVGIRKTQSIDFGIIYGRAHPSPSGGVRKQVLLFGT